MFSSFMTYHQGKATSATCGGGTAYPSRAPDSTLIVSGIRVAQCLAFCVLFLQTTCLLFRFPFTIVLSILLRIVTSDYSFAIFRFVLQKLSNEQ